MNPPETTHQALSPTREELIDVLREHGGWTADLPQDEMDCCADALMKAWPGRTAAQHTADVLRTLADDPDLLNCACGHGLGEHNANGCYARLSYTPLVTCSCTKDDDRHGGLLLRDNLLAKAAQADAHGDNALAATIGERIAERLEYGQDATPGGVFACSSCPMPGCPDIWETEPSCEHWPVIQWAANVARTAAMA